MKLSMINSSGPTDRIRSLRGKSRMTRLVGFEINLFRTLLVIASLVAVPVLAMLLVRAPGLFMWIVAGSLALPVVLLWPEALVYSFFLMVPLEQVKFSSGNTVARLIGLGLAASVGLKLVRRQMGPSLPRKGVWVLLYLASAVPSLMVAPALDLSLRALPTLLQVGALYFVLWFAIDEPEVLSRALTAFLVGGAMSVVLNLFLGTGVAYSVRYNVEFTRRGGLVGNPDEFAVVASILASIALARLLNRSGWTKLIYVILLFLFMFAVTTSYARGGLIALMAGMLVVFIVHLLVHRSSPGSFTRGGIFLITVVILLGAVIPGSYFQYMQSSALNPLSYGNITSRLRSVEIGLWEFLAHPLLGIGLRNFRVISPYQSVAHNMYLEVAVGLGLLGLIPFLMICIGAVSEVRQLVQALRTRAPVAQVDGAAVEGIAGGLAALFIGGLTLSIEMEKYTWLVFALPSIAANLTLARGQVGSLINGSRSDE
jgi:O-antigen ligase